MYVGWQEGHLGHRKHVFSSRTTATILRQLYRLADTSRKELGDFFGEKFYCSHAIADGYQRIWIREKTLEFSST